MFDTEEFKSRLEKIGEEKVREYLANNVYRPEEKQIVEEWLSSKKEKRINKNKDININIAKSAKNAAWIAAIAAIISAIAAITSWIWR
ncbi:MAG: hypothetical protein M1371_10225 [Actinobacteria bacterium]|nr:hypothetical protein [Actinomycetota bacterium]MCL5986918.1 hypothetical protein [Actinomycetota bacterium]